jgi:peptidyl-Lys metalloendopeptidase
MKSMLWMIVATSAGLTAACAKEPQMTLRCELSIAKTLTAAQPAELTFVLSNASAQAVQVLNWQTPFEGLRAPMLAVERNGTALEYQGIMVKRGTPRAQDYLVMRPGEQHRATIDLSQGWDVTLAGTYTIRYQGELLDVIAGTGTVPNGSGQFNAVPLACGRVSFVRQQ